MMMSAFIASLYVVIGSFDSLVTFLGVIPYQLLNVQLYSLMPRRYFGIFLLTVLGIFILRRRGKAVDPWSRTWTFNPVKFCVFSAFLVVRGIVTDPMQGLTNFILVVIGWGVFRSVSARELASGR